MLTADSPWYLHFAQNAVLILISLLLLPISNTVLILSYVARPLLSFDEAARKRAQHSPTFRPRTMLITGVGMTKGLSLARTFYLAGHDVIGADFEPYGIPVCGHFSRALRTFYSLPKPNDTDGSTLYIQNLVQIVRRERVDLWISCSGVASAVEDGQAREVLDRRTSCQSIQFDVATTSTLHSKNTFIAQTAQLNLPTPETHAVTSRAAVHRVLHESPRSKKRYIMKSVGVDDAVRGDMTVLPRRTLSETYNHVSTIPISPNKPWVLQQYIPGGKEYCTHALIINARVRAFVACPSLELLMHYTPLPPTSPLHRAMLRFTQEFAARYPSGGGGRSSSFTGHLSFDFLIEERVSERGAELCLEPIECNPRAHTAVGLFRGGKAEGMVERYLEAVRPVVNGWDGQEEQKALRTRDEAVEDDDNDDDDDDNDSIINPLSQPRIYWLGHDIITLLLHPLLHLLLLRRITLSTYLHNCKEFITHLLFWKDGTYELWDPLPWWWLYHIYWPGQFLACLVGGRKWSRINVSTVKIFGC